MKTFANTLVAMTLAMAIPGAPAWAQQAAATVGMQVVDTNGDVVGTVSGLMDDHLMLKTDKHVIHLPTTSFTPSDGKLLFGMTQAQINAAFEEAEAKAAASLVAGATVKGAAGAVVGTLDSIDDQFATIKLETGKLVKIPRTGIAGSAEGAVIGLSAAELEAQLEAQPEA